MTVGARLDETRWRQYHLAVLRHWRLSEERILEVEVAVQGVQMLVVDGLAFDEFDEKMGGE